MNNNSYQKCTCPRGRYSRCCNIKHHRELAIEIDKYERMPNMNRYAPSIFEKIELALERDCRLIGRGLIIVVAGLLLVVAGNTIRQIATADKSISETISEQTEAPRATTVAPVRDPNLLPTLEEAFNTPIVTEETNED